MMLQIMMLQLLIASQFLNDSGYTDYLNSGGVAHSLASRQQDPAATTIILLTYFLTRYKQIMN